jgi:tetratricopeptide (TPR) repeat protein
MIFKNFLLRSIIIFLLFPIAALADEAPSQQQISQHLNSVTPKYFSVTSFEFLNFDGLTNGSGRTNVYGTMELGQDLYEGDYSNPWLKRQLVQQGVPQNNVDSIVNAANAGQEYNISYGRGFRVTFEVDLEYLKTVRGFSFEGQIGNPRLRGRSISEISGRSYISETTQGRQVVARALTIHRNRIAESRRVGDFVEKMDAFFRGATLDVTAPGGSSGNRNQVYEIQCPNHVPDPYGTNGTDHSIECTAYLNNQRVPMKLYVTYGRNSNNAHIEYRVWYEEGNKWVFPRDDPWAVMNFMTSQTFSWDGVRFVGKDGPYGPAWIEGREYAAELSDAYSKVFGATRDDSAAATILSRILRVAPDDVRALTLLAVIKTRTGEYQDAIGLYKRALRLRPSDTLILGNLGWAYNLTGDFENSIRVLSSAIRISPNWAYAYETRARAHAGLGQNSQAISDYERVIELKPDESRSYNILAWALVSFSNPSRQNLERAVGLADQAIALNRNRHSAYDTKAAALVLLHRTNDAMSTYLEALRLGTASYTDWVDVELERLGCRGGNVEQSLRICVERGKPLGVN